MCPDGDDAKQKLEYTWVNGAIRHIHKVLQIFFIQSSRTSTQRLPQEQSKRTRYDKSGKCEIFEVWKDLFYGRKCITLKFKKGLLQHIKSVTHSKYIHKTQTKYSEQIRQTKQSR